MRLACRLSWRYDNLPQSEHCRRLDTIGLRLLGLIALTMDKEQIDAEVVTTVKSILDYELDMRVLTDPVDEDGTIARSEDQCLLSAFPRKHPCPNELKRCPATSADLNSASRVQNTGHHWVPLVAFGQDRSLFPAPPRPNAGLRVPLRQASAQEEARTICPRNLPRWASFWVGKKMICVELGRVLAPSGTLRAIPRLTTTMTIRRQF